MSGQGCTEPVMVRDLLDVLNNTSDHSSYPPGAPPINSHLCAPTVPGSFNQLEDRYVDYVRRYTNSEVPTAMACVYEAGGARSINNWCRTNQSYGFHGPSTRIESVYQTKMVRNSTFASSGHYSQDFVQVPTETVNVDRTSLVSQPTVVVSEPRIAPPPVVVAPPAEPAIISAPAHVAVAAPPPQPVPISVSAPPPARISAAPVPISPKNRPLPSITEHPDENLSSVKRTITDKQSFPPVRQDERPLSVPLMVQTAPSYSASTSYHEPQPIRVEQKPVSLPVQSQPVEQYPPEFIQAALRIPDQGGIVQQPPQQVHVVAPPPQPVQVVPPSPVNVVAPSQPVSVVSHQPQPLPQGEVVRTVTQVEQNRLIMPQPHQPQVEPIRTIVQAPPEAVVRSPQHVHEPIRTVEVSSPIAGVSQPSPHGEPIRSVFAESNAQPVRI